MKFKSASHLIKVNCCVWLQNRTVPSLITWRCRTFGVRALFARNLDNKFQKFRKCYLGKILREICHVLRWNGLWAYQILLYNTIFHFHQISVLENGYSLLDCNNSHDILLSHFSIVIIKSWVQPFLYFVLVLYLKRFVTYRFLTILFYSVSDEIFKNKNDQMLRDCAKVCY